MSLYEIPLLTPKGETVTLDQYKGKVIMIVNVASKCGLTPQYEGLEALYKKYNGEVVVLGFPSNDFMGQEPGSDDEIKDFCTLKYNVTFPLFKKAPVVGENKQPLYKKLIELQPTCINRDLTVKDLKTYNIDTTAEPEIAWNFEKFIINQDGTEVLRFAPDVAPQDAAIIAVVTKFTQKA